MLQKFMKIASNSEQAENTECAETQEKLVFQKIGRKYRLV